jgi:hypothetical protein
MRVAVPVKKPIQRMMIMLPVIASCWVAAYGDTLTDLHKQYEELLKKSDYKGALGVFARSCVLNN